MGLIQQSWLDRKDKCAIIQGALAFLESQNKTFIRP